MSKISIVMPVYTRADYLKDALNSLDKQTFKDYELILVNDFVEDKDVLCILDKYKEKENVIVIRNKKNSGAAYSRNAGLEKTRGQYVIFLDSDDIFDDHLLEKMYETISTNNSDVCVSGYKEFSIVDGKRVEVGTILSSFNNSINIKTDENLLIKALPYMWNKLVKKDLLVKNDIKFQEISSCNDLYCSYMTISMANKITFINESLIDYRISSKMSISNKRNPYNLSLAYEHYFEELKKRNKYSELLLKQACIALINSMDCEVLHSNNKEDNLKLYSYVKNVIVSRPIKFKDKRNIIKAKLVKMMNYNLYMFMLKIKLKLRG